MSRSPEYTQARRAGIKWAINWLHERANEMNDPHAKGILNTAAFNMGAAAKQSYPDPRCPVFDDRGCWCRRNERECPFDMTPLSANDLKRALELAKQYGWGDSE